VPADEQRRVAGTSCRGSDTYGDERPVRPAERNGIHTCSNWMRLASATRRLLASTAERRRAIGLPLSRCTRSIGDWGMSTTRAGESEE
jgi:hypothetical protein